MAREVRGAGALRCSGYTTLGTGHVSSLQQKKTLGQYVGAMVASESAIVVDNFLCDPDELREVALTECTEAVPRTRSFADDAWIPFIEEHLPPGEKITWWDDHPFSGNGCFEICRSGGAGKPTPPTDWAGMLFLSRRKREECGGELAILDRSGVLDVAVTCKFNRLVLFGGHKTHSTVGFPHGMLVQHFSFNTRSRPPERWSPIEPAVVLLVFTTNRFEYLEKMVDSLRKHVDCGGCRVRTLILDDWPAGRDAERLRRIAARLPAAEIAEHSDNLGIGRTWREAWGAVRSRPELGEWVFHVEEDVVFERDLELLDLIETFAGSSAPITQIFLKRNVVYGEDDFVRQIEKNLIGEDLPGVGVLQSAYFVAMCSLYPRDLVCRFPCGTADPDPHEHTIRDFFAGWNMHGAMLGAREAPPAITHVGEVSRGKRVSEYDSSYECFSWLPTAGDYHFRTGAPV